MTTLVLLFIVLMVPLGVILRMRNMSGLLGVLIMICVGLSLYNLFAGTAGSPMFFAGPTALALMLGWTVGKWVKGRS